MGSNKKYEIQGIIFVMIKYFYSTFVALLFGDIMAYKVSLLKRLSARSAITIYYNI